MSINPISSNVNTVANRNSNGNSRLGVGQPKSRVQTSIFYLNDIHGKTINMERLASVSNTFDTLNKKNPSVDCLKLSSGDIQLGDDEKINEVAVKFQNAIGVKASAMGNHEFDLAWKKSSKLLNILGEIQYKLLANNIHINNNEKIQNKICYTRFFDKDKITITTNAIMWNKASWQDFKTIKAFVSTNDILTNDETKWLILKEIYSKCLNNISNFQ